MVVQYSGVNKMSKVRYFRNRYLADLEASINKFIKDKDVINVSCAVVEDGFGLQYISIVAYRE